MTVSVFRISDMHCSACESRLRAALAGVPGIERINVNPVRRELFVDHDTSVLPVLDVFGRIEDSGFSPVLDQQRNDQGLRDELKRLGVAGIAMMQVMMQALALYAGSFQGMQPEFVRLFELTSLLFCVPVVFYSARPFYHGAMRSLRSIKSIRQGLVGLSMDVPVALAITIAFVASIIATFSDIGHVYYDSVVMFTFLLLLARFIDHRLTSQLVAGDRMALLPAKVLRITGQGDDWVAIESLHAGDRIQIKPGDRVAADGHIVSGHAHLDESLLTGESDPVTRKPGDVATAGTMNCGQPFVMQIDATGSDTRLANIEAVATQAELDKPVIVRLADKLAGYFVAMMLLAATLTLIVWLQIDASRALSATLAVLVVSCPCALALATPAAITAALSLLRSSGVIVTRGQVLEAAANIKGLALDKTGTLTTGDLKIRTTNTYGVYSKQQSLEIAAGLERVSQHPIANAFKQYEPLPLTEVMVFAHGVEGYIDDHQYRIGTAAFCGLDASIATDVDNRRVVWMSQNNQPVASFLLEETYRRDTESTLKDLHESGCELLLLSGDSETNCRSFSEKLPFRAQLDPEQKLAALKTFRQDVGPVMMVGDGINDIPVLANADLSAVVMEAPDLVKSKADVILLSRRLQPLQTFLQVARKTKRVINQNLSWAAAYNITMIPLAAAGYIAPWLAAIGMSLSSLLVTLNAARLKRGVP